MPVSTPHPTARRIDAGTLARTLRTAADETARLRLFLDDLDGHDGQDCDTGTNAHHTLDAMACATEVLDVDLSFASALDVAVDAGIRDGVGHSGQVLTLVLAQWARALSAHSGPVTPVVLRAMLRSVTSSHPEGHVDLSEGLQAVLASASADLEALGDTVPELDDLVCQYAANAQFALVEATSTVTGRIDAGAAVLIVLVSCLDATIREDSGMLESLAKMLADLAASPGAASPKPQPPRADRAFTVDLVLEGTLLDARRLSADLRSQGVRHSWVGRADVFGMGEWRVHADTPTPASVRARGGRARRTLVADARPDELIGIDTLSDGVTHRGVRLLERRPLQRVERVSVLAFTRAPGLVEDLAQTGARVLLDPDVDDVDGIARIAEHAPTGVVLLSPGDEVCADVAARVARRLRARAGEDAPSRVLLADSRDELASLALCQAAAPLFVPQPGGVEVADTVERMLTEATGRALGAQRTLAVRGDHGALTSLVEDLASDAAGPDTQWRLLIGADDDASLAVLVRQTVSEVVERSASGASADVEVIDGVHPGASLLQVLR